MFNIKNTDELIDFSKSVDAIFELYGTEITDDKDRIILGINIEQLADQVVSRIDDNISSELDFSEDSLEVIDAILLEGFSHLDDEEKTPELIENTIMTIGAYFGQSIISNLGGQWRFREDVIHSSIYFGTVDSECFPFHKVAKRMLLGKSNSLLLFYINMLEKLGVVD